MNRFLIVTAVAAERDAVLRGLEGLDPADRDRLTVLAGGFGVASAAAATAEELARDGSYGAVVSAGIAGGFAPAAAVGRVLVADRIVAADLGAETPDEPGGFSSVDTLGFGGSVLPGLRLRGLERLGARVGAILTVNTATGTAATAAALLERHPDAVGEAMEGFGVATAASRKGLPAAEVRTVANLVGPRDRSAWRIGDALAALTAAVPGLLAALTG